MPLINTIILWMFFCVECEMLKLVGRINGFAIPHGLDLDQSFSMVVTNYADNTLIFLNIKNLGLDCSWFLKPITAILPSLFKRFKVN